MSRNLIVGLHHHNANDPFWVQVEDAIFQQAKSYPLELVPIVSSVPDDAQDTDAQLTVVDELLALELHAVIGWWWPEQLALPVLEAGLPIVHLSETNVNHPLSVAPKGLYSVARLAADYCAQQLDSRDHVLVVGGLLRPILQDDGRSRLAGITASFAHLPAIRITHVPTVWNEAAHAQIEAALRQLTAPVDALIGLSDSLTLLARDVASKLGLLHDQTLIVGINGDPLALAAITRGEMAVTVETDPCALAAQAVVLALRAARREPLPAYYPFEFQLVTPENVAAVAAKRLVATAALPNHLVDGMRRAEQQHLVQLETSLAISQRIGSLLDPHALAQEVANIIRTHYGYDQALLYHWNAADRTLVLEGPPAAPTQPTVFALEQGGVLAQALLGNEAIFIPDTRRSLRFAPDPLWPETHSRVVLPIRLGGDVVGLLDLHRTQASLHLGRQQLAGLRSLADQLGIAMDNTRLYRRALELRTAAENADWRKTRLLAYVSQELRTPLHNILRATALPAKGTLKNIRDNAGYLLQLIDDLLALSHTEIDEFALTPAMVDVRQLLIQLNQEPNAEPDGLPAAQVRLALPERLPLLQADPKRLGEGLSYLLAYARRTAARPEIVVRANVELPYLHIGVEGVAGAPADLTAALESLSRSTPPGCQGWETAIGLTFAHRLVNLHHGSLTLAHDLDGTTSLHVRLPLPTLLDQPAAASGAAGRGILLVAGVAETAGELPGLGAQASAHLRRVHSTAELELMLQAETPVALAWDAACAKTGDWALLLDLRCHPRLQRLPFLLYAPSATTDCVPGAGEAHQPTLDATLTRAIAALCPDAVGKSILIVDADPAQGHVYQALVERNLPGIPIQVAGTGAAALAALEQRAPALVLLDPALADMDGFAIVERLRTAERTRQVPVLAITVQALNTEELGRLCDLGPVILCGKDILTGDEVTAAIRRALANQDVLQPRTSHLVKQTVVYLHQHYPDPINRSDLAAVIGVSENYLSQIFRQEIGISLWDYLSRRRISQAKQLLRQTAQSVTEVAAAVGIPDPAYFSRIFHKQVGMSPSAYRVACRRNTIA